MKKKLNLNKDALFDACKKAADQTLWQTPSPNDISDIIDSEQVNKTTLGYYKEALFYEEFVVDQKQDPNLITRAVLYLSHSHAIPPRKEDLAWFKYMLEVLIELACPNVIHSKETSQFLFDIEKRIKKTL